MSNLSLWKNERNCVNTKAHADSVGFCFWKIIMAKLKTLSSRLPVTPASRLKPIVSADGWGQGRGGRPWRRLRDAVLARDNYTCQHCKRVCLPENLCADHIINKARGGGDDLSNLQTLCTDCHKVKTANESKGWG